MKTPTHETEVTTLQQIIKEQCERNKADWYKHLHTEESGWDEDHESFEKYLDHLTQQTAEAVLQAVREMVEGQQSGRGGGNAESYDTGFEELKKRLLTKLQTNQEQPCQPH